MTARPTLPSDAVELAAQTFVYAYPLEYGLREIEGIAADAGTLPVGGPWNELHHARELLGPETRFVSPDTAQPTVLTGRKPDIWTGFRPVNIRGLGQSSMNQARTSASWST